jgi:hypothetical protein
MLTKPNKLTFKRRLALSTLPFDFENEEERLEHLFRLYENMIEKEKSGELL